MGLLQNCIKCFIAKEILRFPFSSFSTITNKYKKIVLVEIQPKEIHKNKRQYNEEIILNFPSFCIEGSQWLLLFFIPLNPQAPSYEYTRLIGVLRKSS